MNFLSLLAFTVYAVESIISPVPDVHFADLIADIKPDVGFGLLSLLNDPAAVVLGETTEASPSPTPLPKPKPLTRRAKKSSFTIAVLGDSMVDTLGPDIPHLKSILGSMYPHVTFWNMRNYGVGGTNIDYGVERLTNDYSYLGNRIPSLISQSPDVVVIESFGYNPYSYDEGALLRHWMKLAEIVTTIRDRLPQTKIVIAATIAPNWSTFGDGAAGLSYDAESKHQKTQVIKTYLENAVRFARSEHIPIADAYHASLDEAGNGKSVYINAGDHIHYSDAGRRLFAAKVAEAIISNHLLE